MSDRTQFFFALGVAAFIFTVLVPSPAVHAQKIVCWKDKAGKVIGCGDRVPPEFQKNEAKVLDGTGLQRGTVVSAEEAERKKAEQRKIAAEKAEQDRRIAEQRRQDLALINTYTSEKEIDQRRDRELQVVELQLTQLKTSQKKIDEAHAAVLKRHDAAVKSGKPVPPGLADEMARATEEKKRNEARIAAKEKDKQDIAGRYADQKARYAELKGRGAPAAAPAAPAAKK
ncbi:MAG: hypothetical protein AB7E73_01390 [Burkholderiales bacterium]